MSAARSPSAKQVKSLAESEPLIANAILEIAEAAKRLKTSNLTDKALYILLSNLSGQSQATCRVVIEAAANMKSFLRRT